MISKKIIKSVSFIFILILINACTASKQTTKIFFNQYELESGEPKTITKSDIKIKIEPIDLTNLYNYPELFGFKRENFPEWKHNFYLKRYYPIGPKDKQWAYPFASPDGSRQLLCCFVEIKNNTDHILRMADARIYFIVDGKEPVPAFSSPSSVIDRAMKFEDMLRRQWESKLLKLGEFPTGFYRELITSRSDEYELINDIDKEILPDFSYEGMLIFPVITNISKPAEIAFFDVTTKTDNAGNPIEKTKFTFELKPQRVQMWFDRNGNRWREGNPPQNK